MIKRILITGSRTWPDADAVETAILNYALKNGIENDYVIVHGDAPGADTHAKNFVEQVKLSVDSGIDHEPHPADWAKYGSSAGPIRNKEMVDLGADVCLAFPEPSSRGTLHAIKLARQAGIPVRIFTRDDDTTSY